MGASAFVNIGWMAGRMEPTALPKRDSMNRVVKVKRGQMWYPREGGNRSKGGKRDYPLGELQNE